MSLKTQAKVLRALEEQRFEPVGSGTFDTILMNFDPTTIWGLARKESELGSELKRTNGRAESSPAADEEE